MKRDTKRWMVRGR
ncbi:hypothetical protein MJ585_19860 [Klebsiella pneumoniae]|nr:hypothetical protein MJ585_19860 [Klebsiella pneumoniae]